MTLIASPHGERLCASFLVAMLGIRAIAKWSDDWSAMDFAFVIPPPNEVGGGVYWIHLVRPSVRLSVRLSVDGMVSGA